MADEAQPTLAIDEQFSNALIGMLARAGFQVLVVAKRAERDEDFIERALSTGCDFILSRDRDVPNYLDHINEIAVRVFESPELLLEFTGMQNYQREAGHV